MAGDAFHDPVGHGQRAALGRVTRNGLGCGLRLVGRHGSGHRGPRPAAAAAKVAGQVELAGNDLADDEADHAEYGGADESLEPAHDPGEAQ